MFARGRFDKTVGLFFIFGMVEVKLYFKIRELKRWSRQKPSKYTQIHIKIAEKREREKLLKHDTSNGNEVN